MSGNRSHDTMLKPHHDQKLHKTKRIKPTYSNQQTPTTLMTRMPIINNDVIIKMMIITNNNKNTIKALKSPNGFTTFTVLPSRPKKNTSLPSLAVEREDGWRVSRAPQVQSFVPRGRWQLTWRGSKKVRKGHPLKYQELWIHPWKIHKKLKYPWFWVNLWRKVWKLWFLRFSYSPATWLPACRQRISRAGVFLLSLWRNTY